MEEKALILLQQKTIENQRKQSSPYRFVWDESVDGIALVFCQNVVMAKFGSFHTTFCLSCFYSNTLFLNYVWMVRFDVLESSMVYKCGNRQKSVPVTKEHIAFLLQDLVDIVAQHEPDNIDEIVKYQQRISSL